MNRQENEQLNMSDKMNRGVCDKLDVDDVEPIEIVFPTIKTDSKNPLNDVINDYEYIRTQSIKNIARCEAILDHTLKSLNCEISPRHIESCSTLIDTSMKCSKSLIEIHEKLKKLRIKVDPVVGEVGEDGEEKTPEEKVVGCVKDAMQQYNEMIAKQQDEEDDNT